VTRSTGDASEAMILLSAITTERASWAISPTDASAAGSATGVAMTKAAKPRVRKDVILILAVGAVKLWC
jgi:hypothetical protein